MKAYGKLFYEEMFWFLYIKKRRSVFEFVIFLHLCATVQITMLILFKAAWGTKIIIKLKGAVHCKRTRVLHVLMVTRLLYSYSRLFVNFYPTGTKFLSILGASTPIMLLAPEAFFSACRTPGNCHNCNYCLGKLV